MGDASSRGSVLHTVKHGLDRSPQDRSAEPIGPAGPRPSESRREPVACGVIPLRVPTYYIARTPTRLHAHHMAAGDMCMNADWYYILLGWRVEQLERLTEPWLGEAWC
jgi:hypothetical protein